MIIKTQLIIVCFAEIKNSIKWIHNDMALTEKILNHEIKLGFLKLVANYLIFSKVVRFKKGKKKHSFKNFFKKFFFKFKF